MSRIGIIREAINNEGGRDVERCHYYVDGPTQFYKRGSQGYEDKIVNYKIETYGLWPEHRTGDRSQHSSIPTFGEFVEIYEATRPKVKRVVDALKAHPDVHNAFIMHNGNSFDIRVQFKGYA